MAPASEGDKFIEGIRPEGRCTSGSRSSRASSEAGYFRARSPSGMDCSWISLKAWSVTPSGRVSGAWQATHPTVWYKARP